MRPRLLLQYELVRETLERAKAAGGSVPLTREVMHACAS